MYKRYYGDEHELIVPKIPLHNEYEFMRGNLDKEEIEDEKIADEPYAKECDVKCDAVCTKSCNDKPSKKFLGGFDLDDLILIGVIFLLFQDGIEDDFLLIILVILFFVGM